MLHGKDYAPCPDCQAENTTSRLACWQCGHALPYTIDAQGEARVSRVDRCVSRAELARLLNQAELIEVEHPREPAPKVEAQTSIEATERTMAMRLQRWLFAVRNTSKGRT